MTEKKTPKTVLAAICLSALATIVVFFFYWSVHVERFANSDGTPGLAGHLPEPLMMLLCGGLAFIVPCITIVLGIIGISKIIRSPDNLKGRPFAVLAIALSTLCIVMQYILPYHITYVHMERVEAAERLENTNGP